LKKWSKLIFSLFIWFAVQGTGYAYAEPKEELMEHALLQQLHTAIVSSLQSIYKEQYSQYQCVSIISINERVTSKNKEKKAKPVDAIHGQKYFEIVVGLLRTNGEYLELNLKNDTASAQFYLVGFKKSSPPNGYKCS
jgi:hypothetical protein